MATKMEHLELEVAHWHGFSRYIPGSAQWHNSTVADLLRLGIIQVSTGFEHALANICGCAVTSLDTEDLSNGDDGKLSSVRTSGYGTNYSAPVTNIAGKTGTLRVQVYERKQNQYYYFAIPRRAYQHIARSSNIEIPFESNGDPKLKNRCQVDWWQFSYYTLEQMALSEPQFA